MKTRQATPLYGTCLLSNIPSSFFDDSLVFCAPEAWELVRDQFARPPREVALPQSMEQSAIEAQVRALPVVKSVFGIGGGSACDAAKMYAWIHRARLVLVPTILSVDAAFTKAVGVRVDHRVRYVGDVLPDYLLVDFELLQKAPPRLNRAGVGDLLSIYTALFDWRLAHNAVDADYDPAIARLSQGLLDQLLDHAKAIRDCTEDGLKLLSELYYGEVALCEIWGNSRPEEGSEHYFAYCLESITRKSYLHGELIAVGILLGALYQEQPIEPILRFLREVEVEFDPAKIGISEEEIRTTLLRLPSYLVEEPQLLYGIYHHKGMDEKRSDTLVAQLRQIVR